MTRLPDSEPSTFDPVLVTRPTPSAPTGDGKAGRTPYMPRTNKKSDGLSGAASIETRTSSWPRAGSATVLSLMTSEGSPWAMSCNCRIRSPFHSEHLGGVSYVNSDLIIITLVIYHY